VAQRPAREQGSGAAPREADASAPADYRGRSERQLVLAMRGREAGAIREFFERYRSGLGEVARLYRVPPAEREQCVMEFLNDVALDLIESARPIPRQLAAYLATAFRHRRQNALRAATRGERRTTAAASDPAGLGEPLVSTACSEAALRASRGPGWETAPVAPALARLAAAIDARLTPAERLLLVWVSNQVPLREIAEWLGIDRSAAKLRVWRLRARLRRAAAAHAATLGPAEQADVARFLRRAAAAAPRAAREAPPTTAARAEQRAPRRPNRRPHRHEDSPQ